MEKARTSVSSGIQVDIWSVYWSSLSLRQSFRITDMERISDMEKISWIKQSGRSLGQSLGAERKWLEWKFVKRSAP